MARSPIVWRPGCSRCAATELSIAYERIAGSRRWRQTLEQLADKGNGNYAYIECLAGQVLNVKLRYQPPSGGPSQLIEQTLRTPVRSPDLDFRSAA